jgi:hypothetical protein
VDRHHFDGVMLMPIQIRLSISMPILIRIRILPQVLHLPTRPGFQDLFAEFLLYSTATEYLTTVPATCFYFSENGQLHEDCLTIAAGSPGEIFNISRLSSVVLLRVMIE